jgi:hypothetical protein
VQAKWLMDTGGGHHYASAIQRIGKRNFLSNLFWLDPIHGLKPALQLPNIVFHCTNLMNAIFAKAWAVAVVMMP